MSDKMLDYILAVPAFWLAVCWLWILRETTKPKVADGTGDVSAILYIIVAPLLIIFLIALLTKILISWHLNIVGAATLVLPAFCLALALPLMGFTGYVLARSENIGFFFLTCAPALCVIFYGFILLLKPAIYDFLAPVLQSTRIFSCTIITLLSLAALSFKIKV